MATAEKDRDLLMDTVSELNQSKRDQMIANNELMKQVNRLT